jgi:hypothetical protein
MMPDRRNIPILRERTDKIWLPFVVSGEISENFGISLTKSLESEISVSAKMTRIRIKSAFFYAAVYNNTSALYLKTNDFNKYFEISPDNGYVVGMTPLNVNAVPSVRKTFLSEGENNLDLYFDVNLPTNDTAFFVRAQLASSIAFTQNLDGFFKWTIIGEYQ